MSLSRFIRIVRQRVRALFFRDRLDAELNQELTFHFEHLVRELVDEGLTVEAARHAARRSIGNMPLIEEECRDHRSVNWIHDLRQDVTYGLRMLRRNPGFTAVAVSSLALGIGANTAIISVLGSVLRDDLPIPDDDRVVVVRTYPLDDPQQETHASLIDFFAWRDANRSFDSMGASIGNQADFGSDGEGLLAERISGQAVTTDVLASLGAQPQYGRVFTDADSRAAAASGVVIISHRLWEQRFGARSDIIGQQVRMNRVTSTVIGVMPRRFRFPNEEVNYWVPIRPDRSQVNSPERFYVVTARLRPGVTIEQAQADMDGIAARLAQEAPDRDVGWGVRVKPLREAMFGWTRERLFTLGAAVALVLLVACANVAGLLLARGLVRTPEMAVRSALGAGRERLVRQLLTESVLLSLAGGIIGIVVAWGGMRILVAMQPPPGGVAIVDVAVNLRTLGLTALIASLTGLVFGIAPALFGARATMAEPLKSSPGTATGRLPPFRNALVATQIALTVVLLVGSGLLMNSFVRLMSRDLHFASEKLLTFELRLPISDYMHRRGTVAGLPYFEISPPPSLKMERVHQRLLGIAGAESVAGISRPLLNSLVVPSATIRPEDGAGPNTVRGAERPSAALAMGVGSVPSYVIDRSDFSASYFLVTPGFFTSIQSPLLRGRDFSASDTMASPWVAIVNETAARRFWPGQDPIGRRFTLPVVPEEQPREVIGVVRDIPLTLQQNEQRPVVYTSYLQQPGWYPLPGANMLGQMTFMVRSTGDPLSLLPAARRAVADVDPDWPLAHVGTVEQQLASIVPQRGYFVFAITAFALTATLLAAIGIYGVMAYSVAQRTREIGIRIALGAGARQVALLVGGRAVRVVVLGLSIGLASSLGLTRLLQSQLWGVTPTDPATFAFVVLVIVLAAFVAACHPLRRATGVNPTVALRSE